MFYYVFKQYDFDTVLKGYTNPPQMKTKTERWGGGAAKQCSVFAYRVETDPLLHNTMCDACPKQNPAHNRTGFYKKLIFTLNGRFTGH